MKENSHFQNNADDIKQQNQKLRSEIDNLRLQNQELRTELNRYRNLGYFLNVGVKNSSSEAYRQFLKIRRKLGNIKRSLRENTPYNKYESNYNQKFKAYEVKLLYPLQENRPKIVHFIGNFVTGGSSRLIVDLVEHLGHQFEQEIVIPFNPDLPDYVGVKIHEYPYITNHHEVLSYLRQFKPELIHIHYWDGSWEWYDNVFQAAQQYGCKIIENINTPTEPYVSDSINAYVYVSDYVKYEFGNLNCRNLTIYPGSNFQLFSKPNNIDAPDNCIGMVYRLDKDKLNEQAIDVFIKVIQQRQGTKALIVGGGEYFETYQKAVHQAGVSEAFTFTGTVSYEELPKLYEQMSIFVAPVYKESFGQVTPFAMNMEIPVVGYKVGALEEIIGDVQLLATPGDSSELANIIIELLDDRERRLRIGAVNRQQAQHLFSVEAMIKSYKALYEEMIQ